MHGSKVASREDDGDDADRLSFGYGEFGAWFHPPLEAS